MHFVVLHARGEGNSDTESGWGANRHEDNDDSGLAVSDELHVGYHFLRRRPVTVVGNGQKVRDINIGLFGAFSSSAQTPNTHLLAFVECPQS